MTATYRRRAILQHSHASASPLLVPGTQSRVVRPDSVAALRFVALIAFSHRPAFRMAAILSLAWLLAASAALGQVVTATVQGVVQDPSGSAIAGAKVTALNTSTGVVTATITNGQGRFVLPPLTPGGPYTVTVAAPGFKTEDRPGIRLALGQTADITIALAVGRVSQKVEVHGGVSQLQTVTSSVGQVIPNRSIVDLPLNQRNVYSLMFLVPGVTGTVSNQYNSNNISVNGGKAGSALILVDGIPATPPLPTPVMGFAVFPSVDAVQEFKVELSSYPAEFGRAGSGIINVILKSGTNQLHGSAYEFLRNSALDANTFFNDQKHVKLPSFKRSQFGASLTGPIYIPKIYNGKNKTFFMFSYEGLRQGTEGEVTATVPTALQRTGDFSQTLSSSGKPVIVYDPTTTVASGSGFVRQPFPNDKIPSQDIDPVAANVINYYPLPNTTGTVSGQNNFFASGTMTLTVNTIDSRVDEVFNDTNRMFVSYDWRSLQQPPLMVFPKENQIAEGGQFQPQVSNSAAIDYTHTFGPKLVMEASAGFSRMKLNFTGFSAGFNPTTLGFPAYLAANADHLLFPGFAPANYYTLGDAGSGLTRNPGLNMFALGINNTAVIGSQVITFGGSYWVLQLNDVESDAPTGDFSFSPGITQGPDPNVATPTGGNSIASLLLGIGDGSQAIKQVDTATQSLYFAAYIQDNWTVMPRLTLNLGLRYDVDVPRTERYNRMETFDPSIPSTQLAQETGLTGLKGGTVFVGVNGHGRRQYDTQWLHFNPRFGLAYKVDTNTVFHAAYGIYYGPSMRSAGAQVGQEGFGASTTSTGSANGLTPSVFLRNPFPNGINQPTGSSEGLSTGIGTYFWSPLARDNSVGYTENWDVDLQRQLPFDMLVSLAYVGSHGLHQASSTSTSWNGNQLTPAAMSLGTALQQSVPNPFFGVIKTGPESGSTIPRSFLEAPFPQYPQIGFSYLTYGYVDYNSFQLTVNKRFSHGLNALVAYTGQKAIDNYTGIQGLSNNTGGVQNIYNQLGERAVSSNDISRNLTASAVYSLPFGRGRQYGSDWGRGMDAVLGGWQVNAIVTETTGFPLSPTTQNTSHSGSQVLRPNLTGVSPVIHGSPLSRLHEYLNPAAFSQPAPFTFGNTPRTLSNVRAPGVHNLDFSLFKSFQIENRLSAELRAESFNLFNQVQFGLPNMTLSSGQFGVISSQANTPRQIQVALKFLW